MKRTCSQFAYKNSNTEILGDFTGKHHWLSAFFVQLIKRAGSYLHHDHLPGNIKFKLILTQKHLLVQSQQQKQ